MNIATMYTAKKITFEEYLDYDDGTDNRYEFVDGELLRMNPPTGLHALITRLLFNAFEYEINRFNLPLVTLQVVGIRTSVNRARIPDLCVVIREQIEPYLNTSAVLETPALLAVEIVSDSSVITDYRYKRSEYATAGISEYWIVDTKERKVTILQLEEGFYEVQEYQGDTPIKSRVFPELVLTTEQILEV